MTSETCPSALSLDSAKILAIIGQHSEARCTARVVLLVLASFARWSGPWSGTCYPSIRRIAEEANVTIRTVQRCIARLIALGEISVIEKGTGRRNTVYRLTILERVKLSWQGRQKAPPNTSKLTNKPPTPNDSAKPGRDSCWSRRDSRKAKQSPFKRFMNAMRRDAQDDTPRPAPAAEPVERSGYAGKGYKPSCGAPTRPVAPSGGDDTGKPIAAFSGDPSPSPAPKWRALSPEQVEEARNGCDPVEWQRLRLSAGMDGVGSDDLDAAAAHRWRAGAIMRGLELVA